MFEGEGDACNQMEMKVDLNDNSKVSKRDIYNRLCACRDFEIKLQWERAVFLTAFLIACFTGYGGFVLSVHQHGLGSLSSFAVFGIAICICIVGLILSLFWIMMAKGSKAWYEHYESAIKAFSRTNGVGSSEDVTAIGHDWVLLHGIARSSMSDSLFRLNGGCYSVSKVVIGVGILSLAIWSVLLIYHLLIFVFGPISTWKLGELLKSWYGLLLLLGIAGLICLANRITYHMRSGYLKTVKLVLPEEDEKNNVKFESFLLWPFNNSDLKVLEANYKKGEQGFVYLIIRKDVLKCYNCNFIEIERAMWDVAKIVEIVSQVRVGVRGKCVKLKETEVVK